MNPIYEYPASRRVSGETRRTYRKGQPAGLFVTIVKLPPDALRSQERALRLSGWPALGRG
ncbi:hypothetical protein GCM10009617_32110 [Leifsonia poae]|uniref:Uncharacterized protein n=1 Tax=Leifsonia poae TaxID=110933 RepID=A0A9W6LZT9_9MICO|nr:hypothetical protein GCM10017584_17750 [Leifsonia poae]